jgi:hypothetical protein
VPEPAPHAIPPPAAGRFTRSDDGDRPRGRSCSDCLRYALVMSPYQRTDQGTVRCPVCQATDLLDVAREMRTVAELAKHLRAAWSSDTSADPSNWTAHDPAHGQSDATSLVIQDRLGGRLLRSVIDGVPHFFNELPSGAPVDLAFPSRSRARYEEEPTVIDRGYLIGARWIAERYWLLTRRLDAQGAVAL